MQMAQSTQYSGGATGLEPLTFSLRRLRPVECWRAPPLLTVHSVIVIMAVADRGTRGAHVNARTTSRVRQIGLPQTCA